MALSWEEIISRDGFDTLTPEQQLEVANSYIENTNVILINWKNPCRAPPLQRRTVALPSRSKSVQL